MVRKAFPLVILAALVLLAVSASAQMSPQEEASQMMFAAESALNNVWGMEFESQAAIDARNNAQSAYDDGVMFYNMNNWQDAIDRFNNSIYLSGEAVAYEEASNIDIGDATGLDLPWGEDFVDFDDIGQGVRESDFPMLMGIIFISVFIVLPITYRLV